MLNTQKGTALTGAAVTDEVLDSSKSVLAKGQFGNQKGLQQFYSPPQLAELVAKVFDQSHPVFDPTAGNGSLLNGFGDYDLRYGVEIDQDQIDFANATDDVDKYGYTRFGPNHYRAIQGDLQQLFVLFDQVCPRFPYIVANPPFGLTWEDPGVNDNKPATSAVITFEYIRKLLHEEGEWMFVCGKDQYWREISNRAKSFGVHTVIEVDDLFVGTDHPCAVVFGAHPAGWNETQEWVEPKVQPCTLGMLNLTAEIVREQREAATGWRRRPYPYGVHKSTFDGAFNAIEQEYKRRKEKKAAAKPEAEYNLELYGKNNINVVLGPFDRLTLNKLEKLSDVENVRGMNADYFVLHERTWNLITTLADQAIITLDPRVVELVDYTLAEAKRTTRPLYKLKPAQRLGFLTDLDALQCIVSDPDRGFTAGEWYKLHTQTTELKKHEQRAETIKSGKRQGEIEIRDYTVYRKALLIKLGHIRFTDSQEHDDQLDIAWLTKHFDIPDPGDVASIYPDEIAECERVLHELEEKYLKPNGEALKPFQTQDISRLVFKGRGLLAWEQGLGKTLGALLFAKAQIERGAQEAVLIVCPGDLLDQWERELKRWFGITPTRIDGKGYGVQHSILDSNGKHDIREIKKCVQAQCHDINRHLKSGGTGWYITHYEGLSIAGTSMSDMEDEIVVMEKEEHKELRGTGKYGYSKWIPRPDDPETNIRIECDYNDPDVITKGQYYEKPQEDWEDYDRRPHNGYIPSVIVKVMRPITSKTLCPRCKSDCRVGWNGTYCEAELPNGSTCGYAHYKHRVRPGAAWLSTAFRKGIVIYDEGTMIQGDTAKRSLALRGIKARHRLLSTGTPIKNYVRQAYWLLWWALGNNSRAFTYKYDGGRDRFENDFAVWEQYTNPAGKKSAKRSRPEITNLSKFWRLLAPNAIRRRKEDTGEPIVKRTFHYVEVPLGRNQQKTIHAWLKNFPEWFIATHPDSTVNTIGIAELMAPMIGLHQKIDWASTLPAGDLSDIKWLNDNKLTGLEPNNYTPGNLRTLELTMALVKQGRKVLVGSNLVLTGKWLAEQLQDKGIHAAHLLDESDNTKAATARAKIIHQFQTDETQVLCTGVKAIRLGHNLDGASAVIINGLDWDYETFDQFIARVHRITSQKPVDIYVVVPKGSITARKWASLGMKGQSSQLALDGRLIEQDEQTVSPDTILREMMERGVPVEGDEVSEGDIEAAWIAMPHIDDYEIPEGLLSVEDVVLTDFDTTNPPDDQPHPWVVWSSVFGDGTGPLALPEVASPSNHWEDALYESPMIGSLVLTSRGDAWLLLDTTDENATEIASLDETFETADEWEAQLALFS